MVRLEILRPGDRDGAKAVPAVIESLIDVQQVQEIVATGQVCGLGKLALFDPVLNGPLRPAVCSKKVLVTDKFRQIAWLR